ncbi:MAG: tRNA-dihydrouridine synthase [Patescibacteria group bacterium]
MNFWQELKAQKNGEPILVLAPMADVTDPAFRRIIAKYGKPDVMWTEFVSADGLFLGGREALIKDLAYDESERPIVAQFFTSSPERMMQAGMLAVELGFDGLDINMGCPDKSIEKQGAGAGLIKNPTLAKELIRSAKEGIRVASLKKNIPEDKHIPVSVKTRIGYNKNELETWLPALLDSEPAVVTIHARTRKEMSLVPARWEHVARAVEIRDSWRGADGQKSQTLIFGNGDVLNIADAEKKATETHCDGVMLGRAIFGNPWCFSREVSRDDISIPDRLRVMVEHTKLFEELLPHKSFAIMKKHYKAYVNGWDGAKELRMKLMEAKDASEIELIISEYFKNGSV